MPSSDDEVTGERFCWFLAAVPEYGGGGGCGCGFRLA